MDNAAIFVIDCFGHPSFKVAAIHGVRFLTRADAKSHVFAYIEVY